MSYLDRGHRDHAWHTDEQPRTIMHRGPQNLIVNLDTWGPRDEDDLYVTMERYLHSNWGDDPMEEDEAIERIQKEDSMVARCFEGQTLQQILEGINFWFTIDGVTRACTHQLVRTRIGCAVMQHGGRDNDWRHRSWRMPETIDRAIEYQQGVLLRDKKHCLHSPQTLSRSDPSNLESRISETLNQIKRLYADMVDAGIPWQDARRILPIGLETYIHVTYNYVALRSVLANRLEHVMDWEINCVAQLMLREIRMKCPPLFWKHLGSHSDRAGKAMFNGLDSWPPDGKYPAGYIPSERTHRPEQMPFFVLTEAAMQGGPIEWISTNGVHPNDQAVAHRREDA